jgi:hypothetical protein
MSSDHQVIVYTPAAIDRSVQAVTVLYHASSDHQMIVYTPAAIDRSVQ